MGDRQFSASIDGAKFLSLDLLRGHGLSRKMKNWKIGWPHMGRTNGRSALCIFQGEAGSNAASDGSMFSHRLSKKGTGLLKKTSWYSNYIMRWARNGPKSQNSWMGGLRTLLKTDFTAHSESTRKTPEKSLWSLLSRKKRDWKILVIWHRGILQKKRLCVF